jgi:hypothetical protein
MRSEIPQIEVITAIGEAELEDYVSQLLFTQGWSIIFRAFDGTSLEEYMHNRSSELRTVIVYTSDLPNLNITNLESFTTTAVSLICLDGIPHAAHEIMQRIRGQLRIPMVQGTSVRNTSITATPTISESKQKIILVTGSSGGPGKTLLATAIASEISTHRKVTLVDADFRSIPLNEYFPAEDFTIHPLVASEKPKELPETDSKEVIIVDMGVLPPLGEVVNDRRWISLLHNHLFETATQLIYVAQTTKGSLLQLSQFKNEFPLLMQKVSPIYICVGKGGSKEVKRARIAFEQLTTGERSYHITEAALLPAPSGALESLLSSGKKAQKEIGSIATSLL